jgi:hypothetical protein
VFTARYGLGLYVFCVGLRTNSDYFPIQCSSVCIGDCVYDDVGANLLHNSAVYANLRISCCPLIYCSHCTCRRDTGFTGYMLTTLLPEQWRCTTQHSVLRRWLCHFWHRQTARTHYSHAQSENPHWFIVVGVTGCLMWSLEAISDVQVVGYSDGMAGDTGRHIRNCYIDQWLLHVPSGTAI